MKPLKLVFLCGSVIYLSTANIALAGDRLTAYSPVPPQPTVQVTAISTPVPSPTSVAYKHTLAVQPIPEVTDTPLPPQSDDQQEEDDSCNLAKQQAASTGWEVTSCDPLQVVKM